MIGAVAMPPVGRFWRWNNSGTSNSTGESRHLQRYRSGVHAHGGRRVAEPAGELRVQDYRRAMYAVTSSVTATSLNSGFVQTI